MQSWLASIRDLQISNYTLFLSVHFSLSLSIISTLQHVCVRLWSIMDWIQICSSLFITESHGRSTTRTHTKQKPRKYADTYIWRCSTQAACLYISLQLQIVLIQWLDSRFNAIWMLKNIRHIRFLYWFIIIFHLKYHAVTIIKEHLNWSSADWNNIGQVRSYLRTLFV